jgi:hypothetical protein
MWKAGLIRFVGLLPEGGNSGSLRCISSFTIRLWGFIKSEGTLRVYYLYINDPEIDNMANYR